MDGEKIFLISFVSILITCIIFLFIDVSLDDVREQRDLACKEIDLEEYINVDRESYCIDEQHMLHKVGMVCKERLFKPHRCTIYRTVGED